MLQILYSFLRKAVFDFTLYEVAEQQQWLLQRQCNVIFKQNKKQQIPAI